MGAPTPDAPPAPGRRGAARGAALAAAIVACDLATKAAVAAAMRPGESREVLPFLNIVHYENTGAAFGLLAGAGEWARWLLVGVSVALVAALAAVTLRGKAPPAERLALWMVIGGALGNLHDRLRHGRVVDFIDVHAAGWHWPAFNLADSAISAGVALYALSALMPRRDTIAP